MVDAHQLAYLTLQYLNFLGVSVAVLPLPRLLLLAQLTQPFLKAQTSSLQLCFPLLLDLPLLLIQADNLSALL